MATATPVQRAGTEQPATTRAEILFFGFGGAACRLILGVVSAYFVFFMTDKALLPAALAGAVMMLQKVVDFPSYPILGVIADRTYTRWGRFRPYLMFASPVLAALFVLMFTDPNLSIQGKAAYFLVMYVLWSLVYASTAVANQALIPIMATGDSQRNFVIMSREILGSVALLSATGIAILMVKFFGGGGRAWQKTALIIGLVCVGFFYICAFAARKHDVARQPVPAGVARKQATLREQLKVISGNRALAILLLTFLISQMNSAMFAGVGTLYFLKYVARDVTLMATFKMASIPFIVLLNLAMPFVMRRFGKKRAYDAVLVLTLVLPAMFLAMGTFENRLLLVAVLVFNQAVVVGVTPVAYAMLNDCIEFGRWRTGIMAAGTITSTLALTNKIATTLGAALPALVLGAVGYAAGKNQSPLVLRTMVYIMAVVPVVCTAICLIALNFYPITREFYCKMMADLHQNAAAPASPRG